MKCCLARTILKEIVASGSLQIILDCDTDHIIPILLQAKEVQLFEDYHTYILTSLVKTNLNKCLNNLFFSVSGRPHAEFQRSGSN